MQKITQAVILAGGQGKRLNPFTLNNPKPLIPINGVPFIDHLIHLLINNGIREVIMLIGYLGDKIENYLGDGSRYGITINYSYTPLLNESGEENKSGIRLKNAEKLLDYTFLLLYCDNYWPLQLTELLDFFNDHQSDSLVTVYSNLDNSTKNNIYVDEDGYITKYDKSRQDETLNGVDIGFFIIDKKVLKLLPNSNSSFELMIIPKLIRNKKLSGYLTSQKYYSIGDMQRAKQTAKFLSSKKVICLDRDGVINKKPKKADYVKNWNEFEFLPGSIEAIKTLNCLGYKIFVISNQPGIARKKMTEKDLNLIHKKMQQELKKNGAKIDDIYYCPHGWNDRCNCRKPQPGLLYKASEEHFFDLTKIIFIGDDKRDIEAGNNAGCQTILVSPGKNLLQIVRSKFK